MSVKFTSYKSQAVAQMEANIPRALTAAGLHAEGLVKKYITDAGRIDTGQMRAAVGSNVDTGSKSVSFGSSSEHFIFQELGTSRGITPMNSLQNTVNNHMGEFSEIVKEKLSEGF